MEGESTNDGYKFKVECTWCGKVIRRTNTKDSRGMCLKCYARMLGEHGVWGGGDKQVAPHSSER